MDSSEWPMFSCGLLSQNEHVQIISLYLFDSSAFYSSIYLSVTKNLLQTMQHRIFCLDLDRSQIERVERGVLPS